MVNGIIIRVSGVQVPPPLPKILIKHNKNNRLIDTCMSARPSEKSFTQFHTCMLL